MPSEDEKYQNAVFSEFLSILGDLEDEEKLNFFNCFRKQYKAYKNVRSSYTNVTGLKEFLMESFIATTESLSNQISKLNDKKEKAKNFGSLFCMCLATIEYGLTSEYFKSSNNVLIEKFLKIFEEIANEIKNYGEKVKLKFIKKRLNKIASSNENLIN